MTDIKNIIPVGAKVKTKIGDIEGLVTAISCRGENYARISYEVSYFLNGEYKHIWVEVFEIYQVMDNSKPIGFSRPKKESQILIN